MALHPQQVQFDQHDVRVNVKFPSNLARVIATACKLLYFLIANKQIHLVY